MPENREVRQNSFMRKGLQTCLPGMPLGLLFGWILAFPMFGPWLQKNSPANVAVLGLFFLVGCTAGFAWSGYSAAEIPHRLRVLFAAVLASGTVVYFHIALSPVGASLMLMILGALAGPLIVETMQWLFSDPHPYVPLAAAMVTSNILLVLSLTPRLPVWAVEAFVALLPLAAAWRLKPQPGPRASGERTDQLFHSENVQKAILGLGAFAVVTYFIGGIWYRAYAVPSLPQSTSLFVLDEFFYILTIAGAAWWLRKSLNLSSIPAITMSALGLGLVLAQTTPNSVSRVLLSVGLAGVDYYYWLALWSLSRYLAPRRVFGWGLGFSLVQIALATAMDMYRVVRGYPQEPVFAIATGIAMLLLPVVFSPRFRLPSDPQARPVLPPANLTDTETKVFALLARGNGDQEIADNLHISRHTVKFHVRNILRKCGVPNRKVLLSKLRTEAGLGGHL